MSAPRATHDREMFPARTLAGHQRPAFHNGLDGESGGIWFWACECGHSFDQLAGSDIPSGVTVIDYRMAEHQLEIMRQN